MVARPEVSVSRATALGWRLERQLLDPVGTGTVVDAARRLGGVLSMDEGLAELAVRARRTTSEPGDLARAFEAGEVVKVFRGSVHYMAPEDCGIYLSVRCAGRQWELKSWVEYYRLRPEDWPDFRAAVRESLSDGPLTIAELGEALATRPAYRHLKPVFDDGAGTLIKPLSWQGDIGFGPRRDGTPTLQRLDTNPRWGGVPPLEEAGPRVVLAFLSAFGPATPETVHRFGVGLAAGRKRIDAWLAELAPRLVEVDVDGATALVAAEDAESLAAAQASESVRLLPGHDQWVMGPGTEDTWVTPPDLRQLMTRKANPVVVGGVVSGTWARRKGEVVVTWLGEGPSPDAEIAAEVERLGLEDG